jgi:hypothetical protein
MGHSDVVDLWEFDNVHHHVGSARGGNGLQSLIGRLSEPAGGTEIGTALAGVSALSQAQDVLLITDGKSHASDVQALARTGRRFSVVLVGEDSLEANVGHLAALSGGEIFVSAGADLTDVLNAALRSLRTKHHPANPIIGRPQRLLVRRAGMTLSAEWQQVKGSVQETPESRAVAALAASIALPALDTEGAAQFAESEGLVSHLASLVLIDEQGAVQERVPGTRKVALPTSRLSAMQSVASMHIMKDRAEEVFNLSEPPPSSREAILPRSSLDSNLLPSSIHSEPRHVDLSGLGAKIDWDAAPHRLQAGDLSTLDRDVARAIQYAAALPDVVALAQRLALHPVALVIGLIARSESWRSRSAARLIKAIFGDIAREGLDHIAQMLGLKGASNVASGN